MKFLIASALLLAGCTDASITAIPFQHFYLPLPEHEVFHQTFEKIGGNSKVKGQMHSMTAIAIATDGTVVWFDHHEDGFEVDVTNPTKSSTQIWGDGDASNGCAPGTSSCTDANDILTAGQSILLKSIITVEDNSGNAKQETQIKVDGGDYVAASFPIAITKAEYPNSPGSLLAGGVEVLDTSTWGTDFTAPLGQDMSADGATQENQLVGSMEYVAMYIMSKDDNNPVTLPDGSKQWLDKGESHQIRITNCGQKIQSQYPVQVHLLAGDIGSTYEMRWYSLLSSDQWSNKYYTSVGDSKGKTKVVVFNPSTSKTITVKYQFYWGGSKSTMSMAVPPGKSLQQPYVRSDDYKSYIPDDSGAVFYTENSSDKFFAISMTDTVGSGQLFDWGFPMIPSNQLSSQVLIGWGYGCTDNDCQRSTDISTTSRSVVFVTPVKDAKIYVDYDNDGVVDYTTPTVKSLQSRRFKDDSDHDMTGAMIYAKDSNGAFVDIAVAWGQFGRYSGSNDYSAQDLGTVIPPLQSVQVKSAVKPQEGVKCIGGGTLEWTTRIVNVGPTSVASNQVNIVQAIPSEVEYVVGSSKYVYQDSNGVEKTTGINDGGSFPLVNGFKNMFPLRKRDGEAHVTFKTKFAKQDDVTSESNGSITIGGQTFTYGSSIDCEGAPPPPTVTTPPETNGDCPPSATARRLRSN